MTGKTNFKSSTESSFKFAAILRGVVLGFSFFNYLTPVSNKPQLQISRVTDCLLGLDEKRLILHDNLNFKESLISK